MLCMQSETKTQVVGVFCSACGGFFDFVLFVCLGCFGFFSFLVSFAWCGVLGSVVYLRYYI